MSKTLYSKFSYCEPHTARKIWVRRYGGKGSSRIFVLYPTYSKNILKLLHILFLLWSIHSKNSICFTFCQYSTKTFLQSNKRHTNDSDDESSSGQTTSDDEDRVVRREAENVGENNEDTSSGEEIEAEAAAIEVNQGEYMPFIQPQIRSSGQIMDILE